MQKLKRGPPYDDDPGCKYIVIEDPWPGNATGKDRQLMPFFNHLSAWVRFMLGKTLEVECIYHVNTVCTKHNWRVMLPKDLACRSLDALQELLVLSDH